MRRSLLLAVPNILTLFLSGSTFAQNAGLSGGVTDPQKAVVANAEVRVVNRDTAVERRTKTNGSGYYVVPSDFTIALSAIVCSKGD
jgi:hypothetical protein